MSGARRFFWCVLRLGFAYPKKYKLEKERNTMNKVEDFINTTKLNDLLNKKEELINMTKLNELLNKKEAEEKKTSKVVWIFAIIGIIAAVAPIYRNGCLPPVLLRYVRTGKPCSVRCHLHWHIFLPLPM